jgi:urease accessory protein
VLAQRRDPFRPIVLGTLVQALGGAPADAATIVCYEEVQSVASAALKLLPTDPFVSAEWIVALQPEIDAVVARALTVAAPEDLPAVGAPRIEQWTQRHATERRRLFVS